jgi:membrane-associated phospholipid phosphatase
LSGELASSRYPLGHLDVAITQWLQDAVPASLRPVLDAASYAGGTLGWLLVIALAFWWSGSRLGVRVALVASASAVTNILLKWIFLQPRPYFVTDRIAALEASDGFGMPSGHAQGSAATWGAVARWGGARWLWMVGGAATFLAGVARVFYGVHSALQVACGWLLGAVVVLAASAIERPLGRWWSKASPAARWSIAILPAAMLFATGLLLRELIFAGWEAPVEWVARHRATSARLDPLMPTADLRLIDSSGLARWTGGLLGASMVAAWYGAPGRRAVTVASPRQRALDTALGLPAMAIVLAAGEPLVRWLGELAELPRFAALLWVAGVVVPRLGERLDAVLSRTLR